MENRLFVWVWAKTPFWRLDTSTLKINRCIVTWIDSLRAAPTPRARLSSAIPGKSIFARMAAESAWQDEHHIPRQTTPLLLIGVQCPVTSVFIGISDWWVVCPIILCQVSSEYCALQCSSNECLVLQCSAVHCSLPDVYCLLPNVQCLVFSVQCCSERDSGGRLNLRQPLHSGTS